MNTIIRVLVLSFDEFDLLFVNHFIKSLDFFSEPAGQFHLVVLNLFFADVIRDVNQDVSTVDIYTDFEIEVCWRYIDIIFII